MKPVALCDWFVALVHILARSGRGRVGLLPDQRVFFVPERSAPLRKTSHQQPQKEIVVFRKQSDKLGCAFLKLLFRWVVAPTKWRAQMTHHAVYSRSNCKIRALQHAPQLRLYAFEMHHPNTTLMDP